MVLPANGPISISQIAAEFDKPATSRFPSDFYGLGGAPTSGALKLSDFYGRSKPPVTPPAFLTSPQISPTTGTSGITQYTVADPSVANGSITTREWVQNGAVVGTGNSFTPSTAAPLYWRALATGPGGSSYYNADTVTVNAPAPVVTFTPDGGDTYNEGALVARQQLSCSDAAVWTYSTVSGSGGSANVASGGSSASIIFTVTAGGANPNRFDRMQKWNVQGVSNGVTRNFTVELYARGDNS